MAKIHQIHTCDTIDARVGDLVVVMPEFSKVKETKRVIRISRGTLRHSDGSKCRSTRCMLQKRGFELGDPIQCRLTKTGQDWIDDGLWNDSDYDRECLEEGRLRHTNPLWRSE